MALTGNVYGNHATARAWVGFGAQTTTTIHDSLNVASLTDNGAGDTTINFSITLPDANYGITANLGGGGSFAYTNIMVPYEAGGSKTTTTLRVATYYPSGAILQDVGDITVVVYSAG